MKANKSKSGIVLLIVLGILGLMSVLAVSFVKLTTLEKSISRNYLDHTRAMLAAESGIDYAINRLYGLSGGAIRSSELEDMLYVPGITNDVLDAVKASYQVAGESKAVSGEIGSTYTPKGDYYVLRVQDESSKLNLNDTDGQWNIDTDPLADDPMEPERVNAEHRLAAIVEALGTRLTGDALIGGEISITLFTTRNALPGDVFSSMAQVREALEQGTSLASVDIDNFMEFVTINSWQDPDVLRPTFQLEISAPDYAPHPDDWFDLYLYSDFQTQYFETEARSPVCVNSAPVELLEVLIAPVQGWFLYEGQPSSLMDASGVGPWTRAFRSTGYNWLDYEIGKDLGATVLGFDPGTSDPNHPSQTSQLFQQTRYGVAMLTTAPEDSAFYPNLPADLAKAMHVRVHGTDLNNDGDFSGAGDIAPLPFQTWDEFTRFLYQLVDLNAEILPGEFDSSAQEAQRFPYRIGIGSDSVYPGEGGDSVIPGFDRYMADALLANFCPNAMLNDHNPDFHRFRHVDKAQLTQYTTEFCLESPGQYDIESWGVIADANGHRLASAGIRSSMQLFHKFRLTTQQQFMGDVYDQMDHDTIYDLFDETGSFGMSANGMDIEHGSGLMTGGKMGPSLTSYPEPIRNDMSFSINLHPDTDQKDVFFSKYDGSLSLSTLQRAADHYTTPPMFMAPMSWRDVGTLSRINWGRKSLGAGDMLPVLWGQNTEFNWEQTNWSVASGYGPVPISTDKRDSMDTGAFGDGRGAMQIFTEHGGGFTFQPGTSSPYTRQNQNPPIGTKIPILNLNTPPNSPLPYWLWPTPLCYPKSPWFDPVTGKKYNSWKSMELGFAETYISLPFQLPLMDGGPHNSSTWWIPSPVDRISWNMPMDGPVTPHHNDDVSNEPVNRVQGNYFCDGTFSEMGRIVSYPATNLGSVGGLQGSVGFWVKPHWDVGYSNRMRSLFGVGHFSQLYFDCLSIMYFPASPTPAKPNSFPTGGQYEANNNVSTLMWSPGAWPVPRNCLWSGTQSMWFSKFPFGSIGGHGGMIAATGTSTDFMPYRDFNKRSSHPSYGFYGHQWNYMGLSYAFHFPEEDQNSDGVPDGFSASDSSVEFFVNGEIQNINDPSARWAGLYGGGKIPGEYDPIWQESGYHGWEQLNGNISLPGVNDVKGEPENLFQGEGYMRFGGMEEWGGPVADSTYDEIVTWKTAVNPLEMDEVWREGRYSNQTLEDAANINSSAVGLYTSPEIDVTDMLRRHMPEFGSSLSTLSLHSVSWTLWWPRYNWRPNGNSNSPDWKNWGNNPSLDGMPGVDIHGAIPLKELPDDDPVYGTTDPMTVDVWNESTGKWQISEDQNGVNKFQNMDHMPSEAAGSKFGPMDSIQMDRNAKLRYRLYFHMDNLQPLLESPVLDDITFTFVSSKPVILSWVILK